MAGQGNLKGSPKVPGSGRKVGSTNKADRDARKAIAHFIDCNIDKLNVLIDRIAKDDPRGAFECIMKVVEYHIPKLSRVDSRHEGEGGVTLVVHTGIQAPPNSIEYLKDDRGKLILDHDGNRIVADN